MFGGSGTSGAFMVGTVAELAAAVNGSGPDKFLLDEQSYMNQYKLTLNTKLIVMEDEYGEPWCDYDYNDVFWIVNVASGNLLTDSDNDSVDGSWDPQRPAQTTNEDTVADTAPGKYVGVQEMVGGSARRAPASFPWESRSTISPPA